MKIFFFTAFLILLVFYCFADQLKNDQKYYEIISNILNSIDIQNENSLYETQQVLMLPLLGAFELNDEKIKSLLTKGLNDSLDNMTELGKLRNDAKNNLIKIDEKLLNSALSGNDQRKIFTVKRIYENKIMGKVIPFTKEVKITEAVLSELQFLYLVSSACKYIIMYNQKESKKLSEYELIFIKKSFNLLLNSIIIPFWTEIEAWHWKKSYKNMKERAIARLNRQNKELSDYSYYRVFFDEDKHFFAITSDLIFILKSPLFNRLELKITEYEKNILSEIQDLTLRIMKDRLDKNEEFNFQKGMWFDHSDYHYAGSNSIDKPEKKSIKYDIAEDTAHSHRWPWWLKSFLDSWIDNENNYNYYKSLLKRLSNQIVEKVFFIDGEKVLLNNFMDGTNGWYRVNYMDSGIGYGPYTLSHSAIYGSWLILAHYNDKLKEINKLLYNMSCSNDKEIIDFRIKYYGKNYSNTKKNGTTT
ncbi:MAG: hypothetical protein JXB50_12465, partial [Spirochaetes bacterium]|nr:hypothetical protein [Spirochaetota bacterium]